jgi:3-hydroxybutyryl-CoA dehydratase
LVINIGDTAARSFEITDAMIRSFADVTGDHNPVHLDEAFAASTQFGKRIAHGMLVGSLISSALANDMPGAGSIYLSQEVKFKKPVFIGDTVTVKLTVTALRRRIVTLETLVTNQAGEVVIEGQAVVMVPEG